MSEIAKLDVAPALSVKTNDLKPEEPTEKVTNDVKSDNAVADKLNNESAASTPSTKGRKRTADIADTSLVIATPSGTDGSRRQTRSQTRGTPAPTPAKKLAVEKTNNASGAKGRRGRPPKSTGSTDVEEKSGEEEIKSDEDVKPQQNNGDKTVEDKVDGASLSKKDDEVVKPEPVEKVPETKSEEAKPEKPVSQNEDVKPKVEKAVTKEPEVKLPGTEKVAVVTNSNSEAVNNHETKA